MGVVEVSLGGTGDAEAREGVEGPSRENPFEFEFEFDDDDFCFLEVGVGLCEVEKESRQEVSDSREKGRSLGNVRARLTFIDSF